MTRVNDLTGATFSRLTVVRAADERIAGRIAWVCECTCGNFHTVLGKNLTSGNVKSCGCARTEHARAHIHRIKRIRKKSVHRLWSEDVEEFLSS